jgi:hypothetical protein
MVEEGNPLTCYETVHAGRYTVDIQGINVCLPDELFRQGICVLGLSGAPDHFPVAVQELAY